MPNAPTLKQVSTNVKKLADQLDLENQTPGKIHAISMQLEGYALILRAHAMQLEDKKK